MSRYQTPLTSRLNRFAVDGHVADRDRIQLYLVNRPLFTQGNLNCCCVSLTLFSTGEELQSAQVGSSLWIHRIVGSHTVLSCVTVV